MIPTEFTQRTMSSREIAELTGKEHKNVLADVRNMLEELGIHSAEFSAQYKDPTGRWLSCFNLPKRETLILVSGYSVAVRARIIDRWQQLEQQVAAPAPQFQIPQTMSEALRLAADLADQVQQKTEALAIAEPKAAAMDRLTAADGSMCMTSAAKHLSVPPRRLMQFMQMHAWIYRRAGGKSWTAYQDRIAAGLLEHKPHIQIREDGSEAVREQVLVTAKGLARLATLLQADGMQVAG